jgi:hypothetical protein
MSALTWIVLGGVAMKRSLDRKSTGIHLLSFLLGLAVLLLAAT